MYLPREFGDKIKLSLLKPATYILQDTSFSGGLGTIIVFNDVLILPNKNQNLWTPVPDKRNSLY